MRGDSRWGSVYDLITMLAVVVGLLFGALELRSLAEAREREARLELLRLGQSAEYHRGLLLVALLPDSLGEDGVRQRVGDDFPRLMQLLTLWEGLGVLVYRGDIPIERVEDLYAGAILVSWNKLQGYLNGYRQRTGDPTRGEWFQWLAERIQERAGQRQRLPAYQLHRDWEP